MEYKTLFNGIQMPSLGLGTYPLYGQQLTNVLGMAYEEGYRLIDTADNYYNEKDLGESLFYVYNQLGAKREDFFLVSKVSDELYLTGNHCLGGIEVFIFGNLQLLCSPPILYVEFLKKKLIIH